MIHALRFALILIQSFVVCKNFEFFVLRVFANVTTVGLNGAELVPGPCTGNSFNIYHKHPIEVADVYL